MTITVNYLEHQIELSTESVFSCEIENKTYFYRLVKDLFTINDGTPIEDIKIYANNEEIALTNQFNIITDYFNFGFNSKKIQTAINKYLISNLEEIDKEDYNKIVKQFFKKTKKIADRIDINLEITEEYAIEDLIKILKIVPKTANTLLDNLFILLDITKSLQISEVTVFVNLKQYLSKNELEEFYKYAVYNKIKLLLIDSTSTGVTIKRERKLIIDCDLHEYMLV